MISDPIADFLIRIKNATLAGRRKVTAPYSVMKEKLAKVLQDEGFVEKVEVTKDGPKKELVITLNEKRGRTRPVEVKVISKPGRRVYLKAKDIRPLRRGLGVTVISTPSGLMSHKQALKKNLGGEVICRII